jgi:hypothetical protein
MEAAHQRRGWIYLLAIILLLLITLVAVPGTV